MTTEQFDATGFSKVSKIIFNGQQYDIVAIDFPERLIGIREFDEEIFWKRCENCELPTTD